MEDEDLLKIKPDRTTWTWADRMPLLEAKLKELGATDANTYVPPPPDAGKWTMRPMTEEERAAYEETKRVHEEKMQAWEAKRREELAAAGDSVEQIMERCKHLQPGGAAAALRGEKVFGVDYGPVH